MLQKYGALAILGKVKIRLYGLGMQQMLLVNSRTQCYEIPVHIFTYTKCSTVKYREETEWIGTESKQILAEFLNRLFVLPERRK